MAPENDEKDFDPPAKFGPYPRGRIDRWALLPEHTRDWLCSLSKTDIEHLRAVADFGRSSATVLRFLKLLGIICAGLFTAIVTFGEGIRKMLGWFGVG